MSYGAVSPVRNQGACIASYAFASIGGIEGVNYIKYRSQIEFSEQQLVDCSISYGNNGCSYGNMVSSYNYILDKGIAVSIKESTLLLTIHIEETLVLAIPPLDRSIFKTTLVLLLALIWIMHLSAGPFLWLSMLKILTVTVLEFSATVVDIYRWQPYWWVLLTNITA